MYALISPNEATYVAGIAKTRIAEVCSHPFEVAEPLFWVECPDMCAPDLWYFDQLTQSCNEIPQADAV
jgi:hypothetical protein